MAIDVSLDNISSGYNLSKINGNFNKIDTALQDGLSRSGNGPNQMNADIDMNGNDLLNVGNINLEGSDTLQSLTNRAEVAAEAAGLSETNAAASEVATNADAVATAADRVATGNDRTTVAADKVLVATDTAIVVSLAAQVVVDAAQVASDKATVATDKTTAVNAANTASSAQVAAEAALASTLAAFDSFDDRYLGAKTSDPTVDNDGNPLVAGSLYFNSVDGIMKLYTGSIWTAAYISGTGYLASASNLSDLNNISSARTNLGLGTAAVQNTTAFATAAQGSTADTAVQPARTISAGTGLTGGGDLSANRTISADVASKVEAEAGSSSSKLMTPERTAQAIAVLAAGRDDDARYNVLLEALVRRRVYGTQGGYGLVNGHVDAYLSDTIGAASTDERYNSIGKYYENPNWAITNSASGLWSGQTGHYTFTGASVAKNTVSQNSVYVTSSVSGDFEYEATLSYTPQGTAEVYFGVYAASEVGKWSNSTDAGNTRAMTNSFAIQLNNAAIYYGSSSVGSISYASGDVWKITRVGSTLKLYRNGAIVHTWSATFSGDVKLFLQVYKQADAWNNVSWRVPSPVANMTLQGSTVTAAATPSTAWFVALVDPVSTVTYNTDYVASITSNNSTYNTLTLTNVGSYDGTYDILVGKVTLTGASNSMNYRKTVANNKELRDAGIAYMWG